MNPKMLIEHLKHQWVNHGGYTPPLVGCTDEDLAALAKRQDVKQLPELYVHFMQVFGREVNGLSHGGEFRYPNVLEFKDRWQSLGLLPSSDCFVFITDLDVFALFFHTDGTADPMVHRIHEVTDDTNDTNLIGDDSLDVEDLYDVEECCLLSELFTDWIQETINVNKKWENK